MANFAFADSHDQKQEVLDAAKEIVKEMDEDEEVPLNDPFAGNEELHLQQAYRKTNKIMR